jgi:hypothetical protein
MRAAGTGRRGREEKETKKRKMVGPTFGGGFGGPLGMEGGRMNLKEYENEGLFRGLVGVGFLHKTSKF